MATKNKKCVQIIFCDNVDPNDEYNYKSSIDLDFAYFVHSDNTFKNKLYYTEICENVDSSILCLNYRDEPAPEV